MKIELKKFNIETKFNDVIGQFDNIVEFQIGRAHV